VSNIQALCITVFRAAPRGRFTAVNLPFARAKGFLRGPFTQRLRRFSQAGVTNNRWAAILACALLALSGTSAHAGGTFSRICPSMGTCPFTGGDNGGFPAGSLLLLNGILYGTTAGGGCGTYIAQGTVFRINTDGSGYMVMHVFGVEGGDGLTPAAGLVPSPDNQWLFGTTSGGGSGSGTVFAININDVWNNGQDTPNDYTPLYTFGTSPNDGSRPLGGLTLQASAVNASALTLYGTTFAGGTGISGTVFGLPVKYVPGSMPYYPGSGYSFCSFKPINNYGNFAVWPWSNTGGGAPCGKLYLTNGWLYGTASAGGANGYGTVFAVEPPLSSGTSPVTLWDFTGSSKPGSPDSGYPAAGLLLSGYPSALGVAVLYGTASGIYQYPPYFIEGPFLPTVGYSSVFEILVRFDKQGNPKPASSGESGLYSAYKIKQQCGATVSDLCWEVPPFGTAPGILLGTTEGLPSEIPGYDDYGGGGAYFFEGVGNGGVFELKTDYSWFNFLPLDLSGDEGNNPVAGLTVAPGLNQTSSGVFLLGTTYDCYGTAMYGGLGIPEGCGSLAYGTLFKLHLYDGLTWVKVGSGPITIYTLEWTDPPNLILQSAPAVTGPWTSVAGATPPYTVTPTNSARFFRLTINATNLPVLVPAVSTLPVSGIGPTNATLSGQVTPNGADTTAWFQYGPTTNYGSLTPTTFVSATNGLVVTNLLGGLSAGATYHYQLIATNSAGTSTGGDASFTVGPTVTTLAASGIASNSATLNGLVSPNGFNCTAYFLYGLTTNYGQQTASVLVSATNSAAVPVTNLISGLTSGTLHHFQLVATSTAGTNLGGDVAFTTSGTAYVGNSLGQSGLEGADADPPLVILGEYSPTGPLASASSATTLPPGSVQDVKFYGASYNFTLYALAYAGTGLHTNEQAFRVVASQTFSNSLASAGTNTLLVTNFVVNAGNLLAFCGKGPYYPQNFNDAMNSDATYESSTNLNSYTATPPGGAGTIFSVGIHPDTNATYQYINDVHHNQGRTYAIGVEVNVP
jgi:uncharacterized repeat protein (TIGR03803 family)